MNIFEKIIEGEIPCKKVLESDEFLAFYDINPKAPIHVLIIPKKYYKDFNEMPSDLLARMSNFIVDVAKTLGVKESGYRLITNVGADGGQEVPHFHYHLLGGAKLKWDSLI